MRKLFLLAATSFVAFGSVAYANPVTYTSYTWSGGAAHVSFDDGVLGDATINNSYVGAGPITLTTGAGNITAYCVDIFDALAANGTLQSQTPGAGVPGPGSNITLNNPSFFADAANLIAHDAGAGGNAGEATQIAIWMLEYNPAQSGVIFNTPVGPLNTTNNAFVSPDNSSIEALVAADLAFVGYGFNDGTVITGVPSGVGVGYDASLQLTELYAGTPGNAGNQNLIALTNGNPGLGELTPVPEPTSTGLLGLGMIAIGSIANRRRTRRAA